MSIHISHILLAVPVLFLGSLIAIHRQWFWKNKAYFLYPIGSVGSAACLIVGLVLSSTSPTSTTKSGEDYYNKIFPGEWRRLVQEVDNAQYFTARVTTIESFVQNEAKDQPPLTPKGLDILCDYVRHKSDDAGSNKRIDAVAEMLKPFLRVTRPAEKSATTEGMMRLAQIKPFTIDGVPCTADEFKAYAEKLTADEVIGSTEKP